MFLIGNPVNMSGREGRQAEWVRQFAEALSARTGVPVKMWDERLTTVEAGRVLRSSGISIQKRAPRGGPALGGPAAPELSDALELGGEPEPGA